MCANEGAYGFPLTTSPILGEGAKGEAAYWRTSPGAVESSRVSRTVTGQQVFKFNRLALTTRQSRVLLVIDVWHKERGNYSTIQ